MFITYVWQTNIHSTTQQKYKQNKTENVYVQNSTINIIAGGKWIFYFRKKYQTHCGIWKRGGLVMRFFDIKIHADYLWITVLFRTTNQTIKKLRNADVVWLDMVRKDDEVK